MSDEPLIAGTVRLAMQLSKERSIEASFHIRVGEGAQAIDERLDMYQDALTRQFVRIDLVSKEAQLESAILGRNDLLDEIDRLRAMKEDHTLASTKQQLLQQKENSYEMQKGIINSLTAAIKAGRKKLNGVAPG